MIDLSPPGPPAPEPHQEPAAPDAIQDAAAPAAPAEGGRKRRNNFNALEIADQVFKVQEWLVAGHRPNEIRRFCSDNWGLNSRVAEARIQAARRQMIQDVNCLDRKEKAAQIIEQLEKVLNMSLETKQCSNAIGSLSLQAKLLGLLARDN